MTKSKQGTIERYKTAQTTAYAATAKADASGAKADHITAAHWHGQAAEHAASLSTSNFKHHQGLQTEHLNAAKIAKKSLNTDLMKAVQGKRGAWKQATHPRLGNKQHVMKTPHGRYAIFRVDAMDKKNKHVPVYMTKPGGTTGYQVASGRTLGHAKRAAEKHYAKMSVKKSLNTENTMSNTYEDLFKSELGIDGDKTLIECPHCDTPITKSEIIAKATATGDIAKQNKHGEHYRGPKSGKNTKTPKRPAGGVPKHGHGMAGALDANKALDEDDEDIVQDDEEQQVEKSSTSSSAPIVRGSAFVQYVDDGGDEALAKAIAEGTLGQGAFVNKPIDMNNSRTRT